MPHDIKNYVAGQFVASESQFDDINPVDGSLVAKVHEADQATVDQAVAAAKEALHGPWGALATAERAALVQRLEAQARVKEQFAQVEKMFSSREARVFREGDNIILRMVGLTFDSGVRLPRQ